MRKFTPILLIILVCEAILFLFGPAKPTILDKVHFEIWYIATLVFSSFAFLVAIRKFDLSEKLFWGVLFSIYLVSHYFEYLVSAAR